jgi:hypothetical protein
MRSRRGKILLGAGETGKIKVSSAVIARLISAPFSTSTNASMLS